MHLLLHTRVEPSRLLRNLLRRLLVHSLRLLHRLRLLLHGLDRLSGLSLLLVLVGVLGPLNAVPVAQRLGQTLRIRVPTCRSVRMRGHRGTVPRVRQYLTSPCDVGLIASPVANRIVYALAIAGSLTPTRPFSTCPANRRRNDPSASDTVRSYQRLLAPRSTVCLTVAPGRTRIDLGLPP